MAKDLDIRVEVKGAPDVLKRLAALEIDTTEAIAAAMLASAFVVSNDAKRRAPRLTGNLARSISPGVGKDPTGSTGPVIDTVGSLPEQSVDTLRSDLAADGAATAWVATNVVYAPAQEFLPLKHKHGESPYLRPALDENRKEVHRTYRVALEQVVERAGG
jgi:hypothetical protein